MRKNVCNLLLAVLCVVLFPTLGGAYASAAKAVYTSDAWVLGLSGDTEALCAEDSIGRLIVNPVKIEYSLPDPAAGKHYSKAQISEVEAALNSEQAGRKVLDYLLGFDGKSFNESVLMRRAAANHELTDLNDFSEQELKNTFPALLTHNYIYLEKKIPFTRKRSNSDVTVTGYYTAYMLFKVEVPYNAVAKLLANPTVADYQALPISVKCLSEGRFGTSTNAYKIITDKVADFAQEAVVVSSQPAIISSGINQGYEVGDLLSIYRNDRDVQGNMFSQRIGYARIKSVDDGSALLLPVTYGAKKAEAGNVTIHKSDRRTSVGVNAMWTKGMWAPTLTIDRLMHQNKFGNSWHILFEVGYGLSGKGDSDKVGNYLPPLRTIRNLMLHAGAGFSMPFGGIVEVMPFAMVGFNYVQAPITATYTKNCNASYLRFPVGLNFSFNVLYPLQVSLGAGYIASAGLNVNPPVDGVNNNKKVKKVLDERGVAIDGLFLKFGLRYNF